MLALGLMSGTSMDGLDCCLAEINISNSYTLDFKIIDSKTFPYNKEIKTKIFDVISNNQSYDSSLDDCLGRTFVEISKNFLKNAKVDLIASHGQTIKHKDKKISIQLGTPKFLAQKFKVPVYYDFRKNDIDSGGNGAPLVPFLDWLLFRKNNCHTISINIGGISNISLVKSNSLLNKTIGFDCGPGMCLIDRFVKYKWGLEYDDKGKISKKGKINYSLLDYLIKKDLFITKSPPKSTTTEIYITDFFQKIIKKFDKINKYDFLRTLVNFTAISIVKNIDMFLIESQKTNFQCIVSGGGTKNKVLLSDLKKDLKGIKISTLNIKGLNIDNKESFLMAVLGTSSYLNLYNNVPSVTGAKRRVICGKKYEL